MWTIDGVLMPMIAKACRRQLARVLNLGWKQVVPLLSLLATVSIVYLFIELTDEVIEGDTQRFDEWVLRSLRHPDFPAVPVGPPWLREAGMDLTALGSPIVLSLVVVGVLGFMLLEKRYAVMWLTLGSTLGGSRTRDSVISLARRPRSTASIGSRCRKYGLYC